MVEDEAKLIWILYALQFDLDLVVSFVGYHELIGLIFVPVIVGRSGHSDGVVDVYHRVKHSEIVRVVLQQHHDVEVVQKGGHLLNRLRPVVDVLYFVPFLGLPRNEHLVLFLRTILLQFRATHEPHWVSIGHQVLQTLVHFALVDIRSLQNNDFAIQPR